MLLWMGRRVGGRAGWVCSGSCAGGVLLVMVRSVAVCDSRGAVLCEFVELVADGGLHEGVLWHDALWGSWGETAFARSRLRVGRAGLRRRRWVRILCPCVALFYILCAYT